jgi:hypothetical protein
MPYRIKRIILKSGELVTERTLPNGGILVDAEAPVVGDVVETVVHGQSTMAEIVWGNWADRRQRNPDVIVPLRAKEL